MRGRTSLCVLKGEPIPMPGDCVSFAAGGVPHHLLNRTDHDVVLLEVGDCSPGNAVAYGSGRSEADRRRAEMPGWVRLL